jgi:uncharacterized membrane protein
MLTRGFTRMIAPAVFAAFVALASPLVAIAQPGGTLVPPGKGEEPVQVQDVQEVSAVETPAAPTGAALIGRMHPALVHFPIAWVSLLLLVELTAMVTGREELAKAGTLVLLLACLSFVPAAVTGFLRAGSIGESPEFLSLMVPHRNLNIAAGIVCLAALGLRVASRNSPGGGTRWLYLLLVATSAGLLFFAGHLGGKMVFGPQYLPF